MKILVLLLVSCGMEGATLRYWVEPCSQAASGCHAGDPELAIWAMEAWQTAAEGALVLVKTSAPEKAHVRVYWATAEQGRYGEARPIQVDGVRGAEVFVRPPPLAAGQGDPLLRDSIVYLTCVHELGHALGLSHTAAFADIMYSFQYGGDIPEYFGRYRRELRTRSDIPKHSGMSAEDRRRITQFRR